MAGTHPMDALTSVETALDTAVEEIPPERRVALWLAWHDTLSQNEIESDYGAEVTVRLLEAMAASGVDEWLHLYEGDRAERVERVASASPLGIAVLEQLTFAPPELELRPFAVRRLEEIGTHGALPRQDVRAIEQLLHGSGESDAAYRVERARKRMARSAAALESTSESDGADARLTGLVVAIVGGHPALRRLIRDELTPHDVSVREIPPAFEATRRERDIAATLSGADVAILLIGQLAHTTSDQVRAVAARLGVPVVVSPRASTGAVRRVLLTWIASQRS